MRILITAVSALALAATCAGQDQKAQVKKVQIEYTQPGSGVDMFKGYCAPCHGNDGKGTGPAASALKKAPADLTALTRKNNGKFPEAEVTNTIRGEGGASHGSRDMPMWGDLFRSVSADHMVVDLRIKNLSDYIRGIQEK